MTSMLSRGTNRVVPHALPDGPVARQALAMVAHPPGHGDLTAGNRGPRVLWWPGKRAGWDGNKAQMGLVPNSP